MTSTTLEGKNVLFKNLECTYIRIGKGSLTSIIAGIPLQSFAELLKERANELHKEYNAIIIKSDENSYLLELPNGDRISLVGFNPTH